MVRRMSLHNVRKCDVCVPRGRNSPGWVRLRPVLVTAPLLLEENVRSSKTLKSALDRTSGTMRAALKLPSTSVIFWSAPFAKLVIARASAIERIDFIVIK